MIEREKIQSIIDSRLSELTVEQRHELERGIYNESLTEAHKRGIRRHWENPDFIQVYRIVARRTIANLDKTTYIQNERLMTRLQEGEFKPHEIASFDHCQMFPENWQALSIARMKRETALLEGDKNEEGSNKFTCTRCKKSRTKYQELQTRSSDEPMTAFIRCLNCGKRWKE